MSIETAPPAESSFIRIMLVDDHSLMREGLRHIIAQHPTAAVVGEACSGREAVTLAAELNPDIILMDISMPEMNGIEATRHICAARPAARVLALSIHTDRQFILEAIRAGVVGYLPKNCSATELFAAFSTVMGGDCYFADPQWQQLKQTTASGASVREQPLTAREREILQLLANGQNNKEIAFILSISIKTVEFHRQQLMRKLDIYNLPELTKYAVREGLSTL